jgi:predicted nucleic acid-binding protein
VSATNASVLADAGPIIALATIDRLDILRVLPTPIFVTPEVMSEITRPPGKPGEQAILESFRTGLVEVVQEGNRFAYSNLHAGEAETLSAASRLGAAVLLDDGAARGFLKRNKHLQRTIAAHIDTVGLLLLAKRANAVPEIKPLLDDLIRTGYTMTSSLYRDALTSAGENTEPDPDR